MSAFQGFILNQHEILPGGTHFLRDNLLNLKLLGIGSYRFGIPLNRDSRNDITLSNCFILGSSIDAIRETTPIPIIFSNCTIIGAKIFTHPVFSYKATFYNSLVIDTECEMLETSNPEPESRAYLAYNTTIKDSQIVVSAQNNQIQRSNISDSRISKSRELQRVTIEAPNLYCIDTPSFIAGLNSVNGLTLYLNARKVLDSLVLTRYNAGEILMGEAHIKADRENPFEVDITPHSLNVFSGLFGSIEQTSYALSPWVIR